MVAKKKLTNKARKTRVSRICILTETSRQGSATGMRAICNNREEKDYPSDIDGRASASSDCHDQGFSVVSSSRRDPLRGVFA